jgi:hypothetical protein
VASDINDGTPVEAALADVGVELGRLTVTLPIETYREVRRRAALDDTDPDEVVADALAEYLSE